MISLRKYQYRGVNMLFDAIKQGFKRIVWCFPTGAGKSTVTAAVVNMCVDKGKSCLFIVHSKELVLQFQSRLSDQFGINSGVIMAGVKPARKYKVQVASVLSLIRRELPPADIIFIDECHRSKSDSYQKIIDGYPDSIIVGLTATPFRTDGRGLDHFETIVHPIRIQELIQESHLVPTEVYVPEQEVDMRNVSVKRGDFDKSEMMSRFGNKNFYQSVIDLYREHCADKKAICFNISVEHSKAMNEVFLSNGIPSVHVDGTTPIAERERAVQDFKDGKVMIMNNIGCYTEGFDIPDTEVVILNRSTKSLGLYIQMVGRGLRPAPNKSVCTVLDFGGNTDRHGFAEQYDWEPFTLAGARKTKKEGESTPMDPKKCIECGYLNKPRAKSCEKCNHLFVEEQLEVQISPVRKVKLLNKDAQMVNKFIGMQHGKLKVMPLHLLRIIEKSKNYKRGWYYHAARAGGHLPDENLSNPKIDFLIEMEELKHGTDKLLETLCGK